MAGTIYRSDFGLMRPLILRYPGQAASGGFSSFMTLCWPGIGGQYLPVTKGRH